MIIYCIKENSYRFNEYASTEEKYFTKLESAKQYLNLRISEYMSNNGFRLELNDDKYKIYDNIDKWHYELYIEYIEVSEE